MSNTTYYLTTATDIPFAIWFSTVPPPSIIGTQQIEPFTISLSAPDTNDHIIELYSQYSNSQPYIIPQNKWSHLLPQWRFTDIDGNVITQIKTTDTQIYSGTQVIGTTGFANFYYIDDMCSKSGYPAILWATLTLSGYPLLTESKNQTINVPSYANSKVIASIVYNINGTVPAELHITRNGIEPLSSGSYWINQIIPNVITIHGRQFTDFGCNTANNTTMLYDYPSSNNVGIDMGVITKRIVGVPLSAQTWASLDNNASNIYFQRYDTEGFNIGGYAKTTVTSTATASTTVITAQAKVVYNSYVNTPYVWVSDPENKLLHKINNLCLDNSVTNSITSWFNGFKDKPYSVYFNTPYLTNQLNIMALTGFGGIYSIAVDPCFNVWCSDSEMDKLYKFNYKGELIRTIDMSDTTTFGVSGVSGGCTPAGISLDSKNGLWVTLFDSTSVFKFDGMTGNFITVINPGDRALPYTDPIFKPTIAETDRNNNVWISFTNSLCSCIYKYNVNGIIQTRIDLDKYSNPMDLCIDKDNNLWASLTYHTISATPLSGKVIKINTSTNQIDSTFYYNSPEYLTVDADNNLWFSNGFNNVTRIDKNGNETTYYIPSASLDPYYTEYGLQNRSCIEGIASDSDNRIWVINSLENSVYVLSGGNIINTINYPLYDTMQVLDTNLLQISTSDISAKSLQAFGDWTGLRWLNKYMLKTMTVTGQSSLFNIDDFSGYDLRRFNESFDITTQIRNYALPDHVYNNYNLFENYIGTMVGGLETSANSLGRNIYEKIANYVSNHSDIDTCNIDQLYSLANQLAVPIDDYNIHIPSELKRIMDIASVNHKILWGDRCKCRYNYRNSYGMCDNCGHVHGTNRGNNIDTSVYTLSVDVPFLAEYKFNRNNYELITPIATATSFNMYVSTYLLNDPEDYCYFEYIPNICNVQNEGVINWDDEYTTINETVSSLEAWYGSNQIIEKAINYYLHKGLGF